MVNSTNKKGVTPLIIAAVKGHHSVLRVLINHPNIELHEQVCQICMHGVPLNLRIEHLFYITYNELLRGYGNLANVESFTEVGLSTLFLSKNRDVVVYT